MPVTNLIPVEPPNSDQNLSQLRKARKSLEKIYGLQYAVYPDSINQFVRNSFPNSINLIEGASAKSKELLYNFLYHTIDSGLLKKYEFHNKVTSNVEKAEEVAMLNRPAFCNKVINQCFDKSGNYNYKPATFLALDIKNLRGADLYEDHHKNKYADIILNRVAKVIQDTIEKLKTEPGFENIDINVGRYGGDEFFISVTGVYKPDQIELIQKRLLTNISQIKGYFVNGNRVVEEPIGIKNNSISEITLPDAKEPLIQKVFTHYLKRGLIFDQGHIDKIIRRFTDKNGETDTNALSIFLTKEEEEYSIYPDEIKSIINIQNSNKTNLEKIVALQALLKQIFNDHIITNTEVRNEYTVLNTKLNELIEINLANPNSSAFKDRLDDYITNLKINSFRGKDDNLWLMLTKAYKADKKGDNRTKSCDELLSVIEDIVYDPLLREPMHTFTEFFDKTRFGSYQSIFGYDMKFVKEINDTLSLVDGDLAIKDLWIEIKNRIPEEDRSKFEIGRRGGTFFLGLKKGENISNDTNTDLKSISNVTILKSESNPNGINVPIGNIKLDVSSIQKDLDYGISNTKSCFNQFFREMDKRWCDRVSKQLLLFDPEHLYSLSIEKLINEYFKGKRKDERVSKYRYYVDSTIKSLNEELDTCLSLVSETRVDHENQTTHKIDALSEYKKININRLKPGPFKKVLNSPSFQGFLENRDLYNFISLHKKMRELKNIIENEFNKSIENQNSIKSNFELMLDLEESNTKPDPEIVDPT